MKLSREEIICECIGEAMACWQYYTDQKMSNITMVELKKTLEKFLPEEFTQEGRQSIFDEYKRLINLPENQST